MTCDEFERGLQNQTDGVHDRVDDVAMRAHADCCRNCRELEDGFRLVAQAFAVNPLPAPAAELTDRIVAVINRNQPILSRPIRPFVWRVAAACIFGTVAFWTWQTLNRNTELPTLGLVPPAAPLPASSSELLFPDLELTGAGDPRDGVVLVEAVEPVAQIFRAVGRSLGSPVRPIAVTATEALGTFIKDLPEPDSLMIPISVPGMREMMPQQKKMTEMGPSS